MSNLTIKCGRCGQSHSYSIPGNDIDAGLTFNLACLNIKRLPRVSSFRIDFTKNAQLASEEEVERISSMYGSRDVDKKIERHNQINTPKLWLIHDFDHFFEEIIDAYVVGSFYPVATSCTTLAERLINLFILKMRNLYDDALLDDQLKKYIRSRDQNWQSYELNIKVLQKWNLLTVDKKSWFNDLLDIRNRAVHFQTSFDPQLDSLKAVQTLHKIIDSYFSPFERKDVLRVFEIPGEIWIKEEALSDPFVKAFIFPCCTDFASRGAFNKKNVYHENDALPGQFSETEFIEQRKKYNGGAASLEYEPIYTKADCEGKDMVFRII